MAKMLIDSSHPEETRVAVLKGNRVEEFDLESATRKQLRGNIYLAKITRVEPSLQAAFVEYGGNRHGFLAFSEIHPDYYQIPLADRQALLREEAEAAAREAEAEDAANASDEVQADDEDEEAAPRGRRRRSRRRGRKNAASETDDGDDDASDDADEETDVVEVLSGDEATDDPVDDDEVPDTPPADEADEDADEGGEDETTDDGDAPRTIGAENEQDSVSEPAADATGEDDEPPRPARRQTSRRRKVAASEDAGEGEPESKPEPEAKAAPETATDEDAAEAKPKRRARRSKKNDDAPAAEAAVTASEVTADGAESSMDAQAQAAVEEPPKPKRRRRKKADSEATPKAASDEAGETAAETRSETPDAQADGEADAAPSEAEGEKPKRRRRSRRKDADDAEEVAADAERPDAEQPDTEQAGAAEAVADDDDEEKPKKRTRRSRARKKDADEDAPAEKAKSKDAPEKQSEAPARPSRRKHYKIQEVVKRRQIMLVQVVKEERGNKGAALTTYLSLAGRYSVLMPNTARGGGISRKITSAGDRKKLKEIASSLEVSEGMGVILRTAGAERTRAEITRDFEYLLRLWENVRTLTLKSTAPCLVYEEGSLIKRSIRDLFDKDTKEIWVAGRRGYEEARDFMEMLEPEQVRAVKHYDGAVPLFAKMGVEAQLDSMLQPQVSLKSGGYLVINQTEALVAIDVNSGKSTRQHSIEDTAYQTNLEAADEVARQLRLRDLAGLIVIDFIDMDERRNNRNVEKRLKDALKNDRARIQVGRISHFGLMEMSRQRMRASVLESATETCPTCAGLGYVRSPSSVSIHVLRGIEEHLLKSSSNDVTVRTRMGTALHILNHKRTSLDDLERRFGVTITIEADEDLANHFSIERGERASLRHDVDTHVQVDSIQPENAESEAPEPSEPARSESAAPKAEADDGDEDGKRRRRGRRGGRRGKQDEENGAETSAADAEPSGAEAAEASEDESKPKRRSRRRKRASDDAATDASAEGSGNAEENATADAASDEGAPPRPGRRPTSRPRKRKETEEAVEATAIHADNDMVLEGEAPELIVPADGDEAANGAEPASAAEAEGNGGDPTEAAADEPPRPPRRRTSRRPRKTDSSDAPAAG